MKLLHVLPLLALFAAPALSHDFRAGALEIGHPYTPETPPGARTAAGYFTVTNTGDAPDRLVAIRAADFPKAMLHETVQDGDVMRMRHVMGLEIPPHGTLTAAPGGYHIMFMGLSAPLRAGDHIAATLVFEHAGEVPVVFNVQERDPDAAGAGHAGH